MKKGIVTDSIEVLEEPVETEVVTLAVDVQKAGTEEEISDEGHDHGGSGDDTATHDHVGAGSDDEPGSEGEEPEETTDEGGEDAPEEDQGESMAIEDMEPEQLREELDNRKIKYDPRTGEKKLRLKLADALKAEADGDPDSEGEEE